MSANRKLEAFDETEIDALLEAAAKYELLHEQFKNGNNVERAMVDLLENVSHVLRRCHRTIRELQRLPDSIQQALNSGDGVYRP